MEGGGWSLLLKKDEILSTSLSLCWCHPSREEGRGAPYHSQARLYAQCPYLSFDDRVVAGTAVFSMVFAGAEFYCLKVCCCCRLSRLPFSPHPSSRNKRLSLGLSYVVHWHFWVADVSSTQSGIREGEKENPTNSLVCCSSGVEVPGQCTFFSPLFRIFFYLFYKCCPSFLLNLEEIGKSMLTHLSLDITLNIKNILYIYCPTPQSQGSYLLGRYF